MHSGLLVPCKRADVGIRLYGCARSKKTEAVSERADVGIGPYGCARNKETEGCSKRADVGIGPYGMGVFGIP